MGEVVELKQPDNEGYAINEDTRDIEGVYVENLAAMFNSGSLYIGEKDHDGINMPVEVSVERLNRFCVLWLGAYAPDELIQDT